LPNLSSYNFDFSYIPRVSWSGRNPVTWFAFSFFPCPPFLRPPPTFKSSSLFCHRNQFFLLILCEIASVSPLSEERSFNLPSLPSLLFPRPMLSPLIPLLPSVLSNPFLSLFSQSSPSFVPQVASFIPRFFSPNMGRGLRCYALLVQPILAGSAGKFSNLAYFPYVCAVPPPSGV